MSTPLRPFAVELKSVRKVFGSGLEALSEINLNVTKGDFFALLGPNGAGKSTLIGIISSLITKTHGRVIVEGADLDTDPYAVRQSIGIVPQEFNFNQFERVDDILVQQASYFGIPRYEARARVGNLLAQLELEAKAKEPARNLSGGMKRRLMIARALVHQPRVLILDEPTAGVDVEIRQAMWKLLRELNASGVTIILTTHYLEEVEELCNTVAIIQKGRLLLHTPLRELLLKLKTQTYNLEFATPLAQLPAHPRITLKHIDTFSLEVDLPADIKIGELFALLGQHDLEPVSLRPKGNRLEKLFLELVRD